MFHETLMPLSIGSDGVIMHSGYFAAPSMLYEQRGVILGLPLADLGKMPRHCWQWGKRSVLLDASRLKIQTLYGVLVYLYSRHCLDL